MSDYLGALERELRSAAYREYASARGAARSGDAHAPRRWRRWPVAVAVTLLLIAGSAAAATVALTAPSAPLTGAVPGASGQPLRYDVAITPDLEPGFAGWCSEPRFWVRSATSLSGEEACAPAAAPGASGSGPCAIRAAHLPALGSQWEIVASRAPALGSAVAANALFSCARAWFSVRGQSWAASAAILVGARAESRGTRAPRATALGHPRVFLEDGGASGTIVARRVGRGWLVAQGQSLPLSLELVNRLRVKAPGAAG